MASEFAVIPPIHMKLHDGSSICLEHYTEIRQCSSAVSAGSGPLLMLRIQHFDFVLEPSESINRPFRHWRA